jgi:hypothetical protein
VTESWLLMLLPPPLLLLVLGEGWDRRSTSDRSRVEASRAYCFRKEEPSCSCAARTWCVTGEWRVSGGCEYVGGNGLGWACWGDGPAAAAAVRFPSHSLLQAALLHGLLQSFKQSQLPF